MKCMHIADVHLGADPGTGTDGSVRTSRQLWDAFERAVTEAGNQQVDFLLISGDLFHASPSYEELQSVDAQFSRFPQMRVILISGNHDYLQEGSLYLTFPWKGNVHFFTEPTIRPYFVKEQNVCFYGMSYWTQEILEPVFDELQILKENGTNEDRYTSCWHTAGMDGIFPMWRNGFWKMELIISQEATCIHAGY